MEISWRQLFQYTTPHDTVDTVGRNHEIRFQLFSARQYDSTLRSMEYIYIYISISCSKVLFRTVPLAKRCHALLHRSENAHQPSRSDSQADFGAYLYQSCKLAWHPRVPESHITTVSFSVSDFCGSAKHEARRNMIPQLDRSCMLKPKRRSRSSVRRSTLIPTTHDAGSFFCLRSITST